MPYIQTYNDCYNALNITEPCSWSELRTAYKRKIQTCHPDKFAENSIQKKEAEFEIKEINTAFQKLSKYYKEYKELPPFETFNTQVDSAGIKPSETEGQDNYQPESNERDNDNQAEIIESPFKEVLNNLRKLLTIPVFIMSAIFLTFKLDLFEPNETNQSVYPPKSSFNKDIKITKAPGLKETISDTAPIQAPITRKQPFSSNDTRQFTSGSLIGDVIAIQGVPTKIDGDTWYYGESTVTFRDGKVIYWDRKQGFPLKAYFKFK